LDRIEVLRGPGSALHGQGVVGGTINTVVKRASADAQQPTEVLASIGDRSLYDRICILALDESYYLWQQK
jgi:outer membrane receptor for ferrienterochelin and colicin